jgi:hypothetical protein
MQSNTATPVNVPKVLEFLGSSWEYYLDEFGDTVFKYVAKGKPILQKQEFIEQFPSHNYTLYAVSGKKGWMWVMHIHPKNRGY